jgi:hypothetical protein
MAEIKGAWTPETDAEMDFIMGLNGLCQKAFQDGVEQDDIVGGLSFMAATVSMQDPDEDLEEAMAEPPDKRSECPDCGEEIDDVRPFIGGECIVEPCGCNVHYTLVEGWVEMPGGDDDGD